MNVRAFSLMTFAISVSICGTYACVGDAPTTGGTGTDDAGSDATTTDASSASDTSTSDTGVLDSGLDAGPRPVTRVFRSSQKYFGAFGGVDQADTDCQSLATANSLGTGWKAWLSTTTQNAKDRIVLGSAPITLVDGTTQIVAHGTDLIGDGGLEHIIDHDETGTMVTALAVWTGTGPHGMLASAPDNTCHDWLIEDGGGAAGGYSVSSPTWTFGAYEACSVSFALYCFGP